MSVHMGQMDSGTGNRLSFIPRLEAPGAVQCPALILWTMLQ